MSNSIICCIVDIFVKPQSLEKVRPVLLGVVQYSLKEDSCLHYTLLENINDKCQFTFIEIWASEEAFEDHLESDHIRSASYSIYDGIIKPPDIKRYKTMQPDLNNRKDKKNSHVCGLI
jgi:quinol monooxygenase YgiN